MTYDYPTNVTSMVDYISWASTQTNELLPKLFLALIFVVSTTWLYNGGKESEAVVVSSAICLVISMLMNTMGLIGTTYTLLFGALMAISALITWAVSQ